MKVISILLVLLLVSCTKEEFNNQYNLPESKTAETTEVVEKTDEILVVEVLKDFQFSENIALPAYGEKIVEETEFKNNLVSCTLSYKATNFDLNVVKNEGFLIKNEHLYVGSSIYNREVINVTYRVSFASNDKNLESLSCRFDNGAKLFLNKEMLPIFIQFMKETKLFNSGKEQVVY